jgi:hypothetical protein
MKLKLRALAQEAFAFCVAIGITAGLLFITGISLLNASPVVIGFLTGFVVFCTAMGDELIARVFTGLAFRHRVYTEPFHNFWKSLLEIFLFAFVYRTGWVYRVEKNLYGFCRVLAIDVLSSLYIGGLVTLIAYLFMG